MPTACELAGVQAPAKVDGISYAPLLKGNEAGQAKHKYLYFELNTPHKRGVRAGDWVAIQEKVTTSNPDTDPIELYNLKDDLGPEEQPRRDPPRESCRAARNDP